MPTLSVHPPTPVSVSPAVGSLTLQVHAGSGSLPKSSSPSAATLLSPHHRSPRHTSPSPPSHSPTPPHTSPPRYGQLGTSPPSQDASRGSSLSPRTYSVPSSSSSSPKAYRSPPVSTEHAQPRHSPASVGVTTERAQYGVGSRQGYLGGPERLSGVVLGTGHPTGTTLPSSVAPQSRDERIRALTQSALRLKERIAMESKRFEEGTFGVGATQQKQSPPSQRFVSHHGDSQGFAPSADLPGVRNVREHALRAERLRREGEAAAKIQAAYRGYRVRKSLHWKLPSGQTLGASLREGQLGGVDKEKESRSSGSGTLTPPNQEDWIEEGMSVPTVSPSLGHGHRQGQRDLGFQPLASASLPSSIATAVPRLSLWRQTGGDEHSVINVFARQHERLRQTLDQLRDQKQAEIRNLGEERKTVLTSESPKSSAAASEHVSQPKATSVTHSYSYTHTFEQVSPSSKSASDHSPRLSVFSEDSLHASSPPKHGTGSKDSRSPPSSSVHSQQSSPSTARSSPHPQTRTEHSVSTHLSTSDHQALKQNVEEVDVHVITPPGSPSFVESFANLSPRTELPRKKGTTSQPPEPVITDSAQSAHLPSTTTTAAAAAAAAAASSAPPPAPLHQPDGRLSPRSLELKLHSELNLFETVEDSMRQLSQVESARAVSLAQQETVALAQLLKSRQQGHEQGLQHAASKTEKQVQEAREKLDRETALLSEQRRQLEREHAQEMSRMREEASRVSHEATLRLNEARTAASEAAILAAKEQLEAAHTIATSAASAAAREAVKAALITSRLQEMPPHKEKADAEVRSGSVGTSSPTYESDFETDSLAGSETDSEVRPKVKPTPTRSHSSTSSSSTIEEEMEEEEEESDKMEGDKSATPVAPSEEAIVEVGQGDTTLVGDGSEVEESLQSPVEELEEDDGDITEVCDDICNNYNRIRTDIQLCNAFHGNFYSLCMYMYIAYCTLRLLLLVQYYLVQA